MTKPRKSGHSNCGLYYPANSS